VRESRRPITPASAICRGPEGTPQPDRWTFVRLNHGAHLQGHLADEKSATVDGWSVIQPDPRSRLAGFDANIRATKHPWQTFLCDSAIVGSSCPSHDQAGKGHHNKKRLSDFGFGYVSGCQEPGCFNYVIHGVEMGYDLQPLRR